MNAQLLLKEFISDKSFPPNLKGFEDDIHDSVIEEITRLATINWFETDNQEFNVVKVEDLLGKANTALGRCFGYKTRHIELQRQAQEILLRIHRINTVDIPRATLELESTKNERDQLTNRYRVHALDADSVQFWLSKAIEYSGVLGAYYGSDYNNHAQNRRLEAWRKVHSLLLGGSPYLSISNAENAVHAYENLMMAEAGAQNGVSFNNLNASFKQFKGSIYELEKSISEKNTVRIPNLENIIQAYRDISAAIEETYLSSNGILSLETEWSIIRDHYKRDFLDAFIKLKHFEVGVKLVYPTMALEPLTAKVPLADMITWVRDRMSGLIKLTDSSYQHSLLFSLRKLMGDSDWEEFKKYGTNKFNLSEAIVPEGIGECRMIGIAVKPVTNDNFPSYIILSPPMQRLGDWIAFKPKSAIYQVFDTSDSSTPFQHSAGNLVNLRPYGEWGIEIAETDIPSYANVEDLIVSIAVLITP